MPGITGIIGPARRDQNTSLLQQMLRPMMHEDFYSSGIYSNDKLGVNCGFVSADASSAPSLTWNESGTIGCFVSGEAFISSSDSEWLRARGHRSANEAGSALVHLYEELGIAGLEKLNGRFSGVLMDARKHRVVLFNDRYGLNRIYIHERGGQLYFGSEAKSLLAVVPELRELDPRGLAEWFSCGCPLGNRTLFRGVSLLASGSAWIFSTDGTVKRQSYFNPLVWESQSALSEAEFSERLEETFPRVLKPYANGSLPVGMSLTGGLDGRMIMAWVRPNGGKMPCYTFNGPYRDCADVRIARKVATACGQSHETISVGREFLTQFPRLAEQTIYITDGAMDVTGAAELYVNRLARKLAPVRLTGNYGSEILRRHVAFKPRTATPGLFSVDFASHIENAGRSYSEEAGCNPLSFIAFKQVPWHHYARLAVEQSQISVRSPFLDNELVALAYRAPVEAATSLAPSLRLISHGNSALGRIPTDRGVTYPADKKINRSLQEFLAKAEYAYDYGMPDWLAKMDKCLRPLHLERLFLGRQKFCHFRTWYRRELAGCVRGILLDSRSQKRPYVNSAVVEAMVEGHIRGTRNCTTDIHRLLSLELLHRSVLERA